jgi:exodeoxyribonuclease VII large subunit
MSMQTSPKPFTVTAITRMIKERIEGSLKGVYVEGELSNLTIQSMSGHHYFSLKDSGATIRCTLWKNVAAGLKFAPKDGMKIIAFGDVTVWEKGGSYQINCKFLLPLGVGELELAFRQLYEKLSQEGLFESDRKRLIPQYANAIGVVTSPTGAVIRDIINIARRRNPLVQIILYPAKVQGDGAEESIVSGIQYFNSRDDIDLLIVGRGGGSLEDLWAFNSESVVRAIVASAIPIISAVGHEIDVTLSDYSADLRAPTPSAAAEIAVWSRNEFSRTIRDHVRMQTECLRSQAKRARHRLATMLSRPAWQRPLDFILQRRQTLDAQLRELGHQGNIFVTKSRHRLSVAASSLDALSPLKILARGYSVVLLQPKKTLLKSVKEVYRGATVETIISDGRFTAVVDTITPESK